MSAAAPPSGAVFRAAEEYQELGWAVFPVNGKIPATSKGVHDASTEARLAAIWFERHPNRGVALATGVPSGVWALDLDGDAGRESFLRLQEEYGRVPKTVSSHTGSGFHLFWRMPESGDIRNSASQVAEKIDVRGTGGYVVVPPSPHPSGVHYRWVEGRALGECPVAPAPDWLLELARSTKIVSRSGERVEIPATIPEGMRDDTLFRIGCSLRAKGLSRDAILAALLVENRDRCVPPMDEATVEQKADQAAKYEAGGLPAPRPEPEKRNGHLRLVEPEQDPEEPREPLVEVVDLEVLRSIAEEKQKPIDAIPTPWPAWNRVCFGSGGGQGLPRKWHVIIGASSGAGKSIAAMNLAATAIRAGADVCICSLEMSREENVTRLLSIYTGEPIRSLEHGQFDPDAWQRASERFLEAPGTLTTNPGRISRLDEVESVLYEQAEKGTRLVIVDYLQLAWIRNAETLYQQITEVSHVIQGLAKELDITTVGISQVNRRTSSGSDKLAKEGLMGGSSLENDAEQVVLLGKPERQYDGYVSDVRIDKNRHGPQREWKVRMDPQTLQLLELANR